MGYTIDLDLTWACVVVSLRSPELLRSADVRAVPGAARVWLVRGPQQHGAGALCGGLLPGPHEEAGQAGPAEPQPGHEPGAGHLPPGQGLRVGLHPLPR